MKVLLPQSCRTLCDPMDCSPPDSSVHGILQVRILEWVVIPFSGGFSFPRDQTWVSCIAGRFFIVLTDQKPTVRKKSHWINIFMLTPVQFSRSVVPDSLRPREPQHARPPCPSPLPESTHTHVHWVGDAIQPCHPLSSPSLPALNLSQHQGFFKWVSSLHQVAKVLELQLQHQSFQWTPRTDLL